MLVLSFGLELGCMVKVRARVRDSIGYETPGYEKVRVRNVCKPLVVIYRVLFEMRSLLKCVK